MLPPKSTGTEKPRPYKRRWGDRYDGRKLRSLDPLNRVSPYIMNTRAGATNYFHGELDIRAAEAYIRQKRKIKDNSDSRQGKPEYKNYCRAYKQNVKRRLEGVGAIAAGCKNRHVISGQRTTESQTDQRLFSPRPDICR